MRSGWGAPGTHAASEEHVALVRSVSEVLRSPEVLNLQLFHREGLDAAKLPRLPDLLVWPAAGLLGSRDAGGGTGDGDEGGVGGAGVACDCATRISRRGSLTWWHLDDGGEFTLQVSACMITEQRFARLPAGSLGTTGSVGNAPQQPAVLLEWVTHAWSVRARGDQYTTNDFQDKLQVAAPLAEASLVEPVLRGPSGRPVVKIFLFAPAEAYDFISQDDVADATHKFAQLDPFTAASSHLPAGRLASGAHHSAAQCDRA
jgi:hypothetical protein